MSNQISVVIDPLIPVREAFAIAGVGVSKGYGEVRARRLLVIRNGTRTFVRASEIRRYIDALEAVDAKNCRASAS